MDLKTFRAKSMAECLAEVKRDLGNDAVILRTRTVRTGGVLGIASTPLVELTASATMPDAGARPSLAARRAQVEAIANNAAAPPPTESRAPAPPSVARAEVLAREARVFARLAADAQPASDQDFGADRRGAPPRRPRLCESMCALSPTAPGQAPPIWRLAAK